MKTRRIRGQAPGGVEPSGGRTERSRRRGGGGTATKPRTPCLALIVAALFLLTDPASAENTIIQLGGINSQGQFTISLEKTAQNTGNYVFFLVADRLTSDYKWSQCYHGPLDEVKCERDLWIAVVTPPLPVNATRDEPLVAFIQMVDGAQFKLKVAGFVSHVLAGTEFVVDIPPSFRLGVTGQGFFAEPYPPSGFYFGLTQAQVNALPPGTYSFFVFYTTRIPGSSGLAISIHDLAPLLVSNVDQYDIVVQEGTRPCGTQQVAGGDNGDTRLFDLGRKSGKFQFDYQTFTQKDRMVVRYEGKTLFETGCVGASSSVTLSYSGNSSQVQVDVFPNCAGGQGTQWNYTVHCAVP